MAADEQAREAAYMAAAERTPHAADLEGVDRAIDAYLDAVAREPHIDVIEAVALKLRNGDSDDGSDCDEAILWEAESYVTAALSALRGGGAHG